MKAESAIFPSPGGKYSVKVSDTQAYWVRFIQDGVAVVKLQQNPNAIKREGDTLYEYDENEIRIREEDIKLLPKNFPAIWDKYALKNERVDNPVMRNDARLLKSKISVSLSDLEENPVLETI